MNISGEISHGVAPVCVCVYVSVVSGFVLYTEYWENIGPACCVCVCVCNLMTWAKWWSAEFLVCKWPPVLPVHHEWNNNTRYYQKPSVLLLKGSIVSYSSKVSAELIYIWCNANIYSALFSPYLILGAYLCMHEQNKPAIGLNLLWMCSKLRLADEVLRLWRFIVHCWHVPHR